MQTNIRYSIIPLRNKGTSCKQDLEMRLTASRQDRTLSRLVQFDYQWATENLLMRMGHQATISPDDWMLSIIGSVKLLDSTDECCKDDDAQIILRFLLRLTTTSFELAFHLKRSSWDLRDCIRCVTDERRVHV